MTERWKPVPNYEGRYEFSSLHRVKALARDTPDRKSLKERFLKVSPVNGYLVARLGSEQFSFYVEKAVLLHFPDTQPAIACLPGEEWRDIRGYEGLYRISSLGRVLSLARVIDDGQGRSRYIRPRVLERGTDGAGYPKTELAKNGGTVTVLIHRLVADAFVPNPLCLECVHHKDEDKRNCVETNLEWTTRGGNVQDWFDRRRVEVSAATIETIIAAHQSGKTPAEILAALPRQRKLRK